jgi:hypothetical protein
VLAALSLLLLALMVALSFNLSHALRGKTRLQQHSDALAYSMAILEARALNYFAVSNRAIAASYVAMNSLHATQAAASVTAEMMRAARTNFYVIAALEFAQCPPKSYQHCRHAYQALRIARKFSRESSQYERKIRELEGPFNEAVGSLDRMMDDLHQSQRRVFEETRKALKDGTSLGLGRLKAVNTRMSAGERPRGRLASDLHPAVGAMNALEFSCAIDGMPCASREKPRDSALVARARVMTEVANASRPDWPANRGGAVLPKHLHPRFLDDLMRNIQGDGASMPRGHAGTAKTVQRRGRSGLHGGQARDNAGKVSAADEHGGLFSQWKDGAFYSNYSAEIASDADGGFHRRAHRGRHDRFQGVYTRELMACARQGHCFMKFRADPSPEHDFGQPRVYSYVTQALRVGDVKEAPWELNRSARVRLRHGHQGEARVDLAADEGAGLSKALVYYHRLGDWREQPNLFSPFWRAKLHPFRPVEAARVLESAGNTDAAELARTRGLPL